MWVRPSQRGVLARADSALADGNEKVKEEPVRQLTSERADLRRDSVRPRKASTTTRRRWRSLGTTEGDQGDGRGRDRGKRSGWTFVGSS
jgi:hypothetical protein